MFEGSHQLKRSVLSISTLLLAVLLINSTEVAARVHHQHSSRTQDGSFAVTTQVGKPGSNPRTITDEALLTQVTNQLLAAARTHPANMVWPPSIRLLSEGEINAYATLLVDQLGTGKWKERVDKQGRFLPVVAVDRLMMEEVIQGNPDRLAMLIGHELSHLLLGHVLPTNVARRAKTGTLTIIFTSEQEHEADINGIKLALAAGYSYRGVREIWEVLSSDSFTRKHPQTKYSSFEAAGADHPSWTDRLSYIDKEKANVWKSMSAFENGSTFLQLQQYPSAEEAFLRVTQEFPENYEAWANLGYARLMMYLDAFDPDDLKRYDLGQLVLGSFYFRSEELRSKTRGVDAKMWQQAVDALRKSLELKPDLSLAYANLGVAFLLNPAGRDSQTASAMMETAIAGFEHDKNLFTYNAAAILINAAAAHLANGNNELSSLRLGQAEGLTTNDAYLSGAISYNRALLVMSGVDATDIAGQKEKRTTALASWVKFLETTSPASVWWTLGYNRYSELMKDQGLTPERKATLCAGTKIRLRPIPSVAIAPGVLITLSDRIESVRSKINSLTAIPVVGSSIQLLHHSPSGSDLLAGRRVIAIYLHGPTAPSLTVKPMGTGSRTSSLGVGMIKKDVERLLGVNFVLAPLNDPYLRYYFYPELGVGIHYDKTFKIDELVLAQIAVTQN